MADIADQRLARLREQAVRRRTKEQEQEGTEAELPPSDEGTEKATRVASRVAPSHRLQQQHRRPTLRRAYTLYADQDEMLRQLAYELETDKSDVLRQIVDAWLDGDQ